MIRHLYNLWQSHFREAKLIPFISIHFGINWGDSHAGIPEWRIRGSKYLKFEMAVDEVTELTEKMNTNVSLIFPQEF